MREKHHKDKKRDIRVNTRHFSFKSFLMIYLTLMILTSGQAMILSSFLHLDIYTTVSFSYVAAMTGYWAIVSLIYCLISERQHYLRYDKPMITLSKAAKKVAEGDYSIKVQPLRNDGKKDYVDVMIEDFNKMVVELRSTEILKNDFIANVSHEIKSPLSVIQSYAMALQKENLDVMTKKEYTETIVTASKKMTALVTNILKLNKLENQEIQVFTEPFDLSRQLSECALSFEEFWERKDITFVADIEERAMVNADRDMLEIVWNNLLSNAIKFTEPGGTIKLLQTLSADSVTVIIEDSGCGMSEEIMKRIFDKFYQGDTSHSQEGNGLGLAITKKIIDIVGGKLSVQSKPGFGTTFTVTLNLIK